MIKRLYLKYPLRASQRRYTALCSKRGVKYPIYIKRYIRSVWRLELKGGKYQQHNSNK